MDDSEPGDPSTSTPPLATHWPMKKKEHDASPRLAFFSNRLYLYGRREGSDGVQKAISNNLDESGIIDTAGSLWLASSSPATF